MELHATIDCLYQINDGGELNMNKEDLPKELSDSAKSLEHIGISEMAWDWQNAIKAVEFLYQCNYVVLGGDVYNGHLESTYDSWYINKDEAKSREEFIRQARDRAVSYISQYHDTNGDEYYYSIVFDKI